MADVVKSIKADDPATFLEKAHAEIGKGDALGFTKFDLNKTKIVLDADKKVVSVSINPTISVTRTSWSGLSGDAQNTLKEIDAWIKQHEQKHVKIIESEIAKGQKQFQKDAVGKTEAEVQKMLKDFAEEIQEKSDSLDSKEGSIDVDKTKLGKWTWKEGPA